MSLIKHFLLELPIVSMVVFRMACRLDMFCHKQDNINGKRRNCLLEITVWIIGLRESYLTLMR